MEQAVFKGEVKAPGKFIPFDAVLFQGALRQRIGQKIEVVLRAPRTTRTLDQNAYAHAWPFKMIADAMGEPVEAAKLAVLGEYFGWRELRGHHVPVKPSTSMLTVEEFSQLIDWMPSFALETFDIHIPLPNELEAR